MNLDYEPWDYFARSIKVTQNHGVTLIGLLQFYANLQARAITILKTNFKKLQKKT